MASGAEFSVTTFTAMRYLSFCFFSQFQGEVVCLEAQMRVVYGLASIWYGVHEGRVEDLESNLRFVRVELLRKRHGPRHDQNGTSPSSDEKRRELS